MTAREPNLPPMTFAALIPILSLPWTTAMSEADVDDVANAEGKIARVDAR